MKRLILTVFYTVLGIFFTKNITCFDKMGIVEHRTILSDNANNNGIIPPAKRA